MSQLATCLQTAHNFLLSQEEAKAIFEHQIQIVEDNFDAVCTEAELTEIDKQLFWQRQFLKFFFYNAVAHSRFCPLNY